MVSLDPDNMNLPPCSQVYQEVERHSHPAEEDYSTFISKAAAAAAVIPRYVNIQQCSTHKHQTDQSLQQKE